MSVSASKPKIVLFSGGPKNGEKELLRGDEEEVRFKRIAAHQSQEGELKVDTFRYELCGFRIDGEEIWIGYPEGESAKEAMARIFHGFMEYADRERRESPPR